MLAYRLRATQNKMLNLSLSLTLALQLLPSQQIPVPPIPLFFKICSSCSFFSSPFRLFRPLACNLLFASPFLPPSFATYFLLFSFAPSLILFQSSPLPSAAQSLISHCYFFILFSSLSHTLHLFIPFFSQRPDRGLGWPFNVSLCFSLLLTVSILSQTVANATERLQRS